MTETRAKYANVKQQLDGHTFDSKKEMNQYVHLKALQQAKIISGLELQKRYELIPKQKLSNGKTERAAHYTADFFWVEGGKEYVVDVKSPITRKEPSYVLRRKLMLYVHGIEIKEI